MYKTITERLKIIFESRSYKQKKSEKMTSMHSLYGLDGVVGEDQIKEDEGMAPAALQGPPIDEQKLKEYTCKKYNRVDRMYLIAYCILLLIETVYEIWLVGLVLLQLSLRLLSGLGLLISIYKYKDSFSFSRFWLKLLLVTIQTFILISLNS